MEERSSKAVIVFGRFQPPTLAHRGLFLYASEYASATKADFIAFTSPSLDNKSNPIPYEIKIEALQTYFPEVNFVKNPLVKHPFDALCMCGKLRYSQVTIVLGEDRVDKYRDFLKYINHPDPKKAVPNVEKLYLLSYGARDPDADGKEGISATKARMEAKFGDYIGFKRLLPDPYNEEMAQKLYNIVRRGMGINEP